MTGVVGILLAAGQATRFGSDKLLYEICLDGITQPLIQHSLLPWLTAFESLCIVLRPDQQSLRDSILQTTSLHNKTIQLIETDTAKQGMGHSLAAAIAENRGAAGWVIGLADMPLIPAALLIELVEALKDGAKITAPFYHGERGHPVGFNKMYQNALLGLKGDKGAKQLLQRDAHIISKIETLCGGVVMDIDRKSDVEKIAVQPLD